MSHIVDGEDAEAAVWAERAARAPGAHVLIAVIAMVAHALHGDRERAAAWAATVRERSSSGGITAADFFRSFPFADERARRRIGRALAGVGM